jgi:hypothetical membrane protein
MLSPSALVPSALYEKAGRSTRLRWSPVSLGALAGWAPDRLALGQGRRFDPGSDQVIPAWVVACAGLIPVLLLAGWVVADALQSAAYSPMRETISVLAGRAAIDPWVMTGSLLLIGICYLAAAAGLTGIGTLARAGLVAAGLCAFGIAASPEPATSASTRHAVFAGIGAAVIALWPALVERQFPSRWTVAGLPAGLAATMVLAAMLVWTFAETRAGSSLGMAERVSSSSAVCWPFVVAVQLAWDRRHAVPRTTHTAAGEAAERPTAENAGPARAGLHGRPGRLEVVIDLRSRAIHTERAEVQDVVSGRG